MKVPLYPYLKVIFLNGNNVLLHNFIIYQSLRENWLDKNRMFSEAVGMMYHEN